MRSQSHGPGRTKSLPCGNRLPSRAHPRMPRRPSRRLLNGVPFRPRWLVPEPIESRGVGGEPGCARPRTRRRARGDREGAGLVAAKPVRTSHPNQWTYVIMWNHPCCPNLWHLSEFDGCRRRVSIHHIPNIGMTRTVGQILVVQLLGHRRTCHTAPTGPMVLLSLVEGTI